MNPKDCHSSCRHHTVSKFIIIDLRIVDWAIEFDHKSSIGAVEIGNVSVDDLLPAKFYIIQSAAT